MNLLCTLGLHDWKLVGGHSRRANRVCLRCGEIDDSWEMWRKRKQAREAKAQKLWNSRVRRDQE